MKPEQPFPVTIARRPSDAEKNMVLSDWRRSLRDSPAFESMPSSAFRYWFNALASYFLGPTDGRIELAPEARLIVLRRADRPSFSVGWALFTVSREHPDRLVLLHTYVKKDFRGHGFGNLLLKSALDQMPEEAELCYGLRAREWVQTKLEKQYGATYWPVQNIVHGRDHA